MPPPATTHAEVELIFGLTKSGITLSLFCALIAIACATARHLTRRKNQPKTGNAAAATIQLGKYQALIFSSPIAATLIACLTFTIVYHLFSSNPTNASFQMGIFAIIGFATPDIIKIVPTRIKSSINPNNTQPPAA